MSALKDKNRLIKNTERTVAKTGTFKIVSLAKKSGQNKVTLTAPSGAGTHIAKYRVEKATPKSKVFPSKRVFLSYHRDERSVMEAVAKQIRQHFENIQSDRDRVVKTLRDAPSLEALDFYRNLSKR